MPGPIRKNGIRLSMILCPQCQTLNEVASARCAGCGNPLDGDDASLGSDPYIGRQLGDRFFLQTFLGSGDIGLVYRGTDVSTGQEVAVKVIHPDVAATIGDRLLRSAVAISQVRHPKLASVLAAAREHDGTLYVATEYLRGQTLKQMLEHNGPLGPRRASDILFQLASALAPIHKVGRPHANLKPENVFLVERDGTTDFVRICDVGVPDLFGVRKTAQGQVINGSPKYFSPEQAQGQPATVASDQFTLGIIAYQLLTGALPFFGATPDQLLAAIAAGTPTPIARRTPGIQLPPKLEQIITRCLSKSPSERYADLRALATDVAAVIKSTQPEAAPPRKKGFVQASTIMADPGMIGSLQANAEFDEGDDDRTNIGEAVWGQETTGQHTPIGGELTPATDLPAMVANAMRPGVQTVPVPPPPPAHRPPRPPTQNDMKSMPPPLMATGALDSSDLRAALDSAQRPASRPAAPARKSSFDDDLQAALAAAAAEVGESPKPTLRSLGGSDPLATSSMESLNLSPPAQPAARPGPPPGVRLTHEIMSAIDEELVDASVSMTAAGVNPTPLSSAQELRDIKRPTDTLRPVSRPMVQGGGRKKLFIAVGAVVLGGAAGAYFMAGGSEDTPQTNRAAPSMAVPAGASSAAPMAAPSAVPSPSVAASAAASQAVSAAASQAASAAEDLPASIRAEQQRKLDEIAKAAASAAPSNGADALPAPLTWHINSDPAGATIVENGKPIGVTPFDVTLETKAIRHFTLKLDGYESTDVGADPKLASNPSVSATLKKAGAAAPPAPKPKPAGGGGNDAAPKPPAPPTKAPAPASKPKPKPKPSTEVEDPFANP